MTFLATSGTLAELRIQHGTGVELSEKITGVPQFDLSANETSQLVFTISDPDLSLLAAGTFAVGTNVDYYDLKFEIAAVATGGGSEAPTVEITARARGVQVLKRRKGALVSANVSPTEWSKRECESAGLLFFGQESPVATQITRAEPKTGETGEKESSWDVITRLANELGYVAFESAGIVYFGKPSWLIARPNNTVWTARWPEATADGELSPQEVPVCRRTADSEPPVSIEIAVAYAQGVRVRPGDKIVFAGMPTFEGEYLVTSVPIAMDGTSNVSLTIATPVDPEPGKKKEELFGDTAPLEPLGGNLDDFKEPAVTYPFRWPCQGAVSRKWEAADDDVAGGFGGGHYGIDIQFVRGERIHAARAGTVKYVGQAIEDPKFVKVDDARKEIQVPNNANHGLTVEIEHAWGAPAERADEKHGFGFLTSRYQHLERFVVKKGDKVTAGQLIGYMGTSGSGPVNTPAADATRAYINAQGGQKAGTKPPPMTKEEATRAYMNGSRPGTAAPAPADPWAGVGDLAMLHFEIRDGNTPRNPEEGWLPPRVAKALPPTPKGSVLGPAKASII